MRRIKIAGLIIAATITIGASSASAKVVTFYVYNPPSMGGHGYEVMRPGDGVDTRGPLSVVTSRGDTACGEQNLLAMSLNTDQKATDKLTVDGALGEIEGKSAFFGGTPMSCGTGDATAFVYAQRFPWMLSVNASHKAKLRTPYFELAFFEGPTCLYKASVLRGSFDEAQFLTFTEQELRLAAGTGCPTTASFNASFPSFTADGPTEYVAIETKPKS